jgi:hypothetical protein
VPAGTIGRPCGAEFARGMRRGVNDTLPDSLTRLAQSMESLQPAGAQPAWVEIIGPLDEPERVRWHPDLETMVGFVAPATCHAIAAVGYGWARHLEELSPGGGVAVPAPGERKRCRVVCLITRSGEMAGYLRTGPQVIVDEPPTVGRVPDLMRRCFGLPTPPPEETTDGILARMWLGNVLGAGEQATTPLTWPTVAALHPAVQVAAQAGLTIPLDELTRILRVAAETWSWSHLSQQVAEDGWLAELLPEGAGGWMDEGILSRWLLASLADVDSLLAEVTPLIAPAAARKLRVTLRRLDVLPERTPGRRQSGDRPDPSPNP